jgi:hypothetical protein
MLHILLKRIERQQITKMPGFLALCWLLTLLQESNHEQTA